MSSASEKTKEDWVNYLNEKAERWGLPAWASRDRASEFLSRFLFPVAPRTLGTWDIATKLINRRLLVSREDLFLAAVDELKGAPDAGKAPASIAHASHQDA